MSDLQNEEREDSGGSEGDMEMEGTDSSSEGSPILPLKKRKRRGVK